MEIYNEKKETLARFIERTLLGWPKNLRVYDLYGRAHTCYESDDRWKIHLEEIDGLLKENS